MSFSLAAIQEGYELDLHAHDVPLIQCFLAERQGLDLHVIERVDTPDPQLLLPGVSAHDLEPAEKRADALPAMNRDEPAEGDRWLFESMETH